MAQSYLIFDFGGNEEAAQRAKHRIEAWRQAFRLGKKMELKFERASQGKKEGGEHPGAKSKESESPSDADEKIRLLVRLDFSDHEKLSHQRWLDRIPTEEPFKDASRQVVRSGDANHTATSDLFDSLS